MRAFAPTFLILAVAACNNEPPAPKPVETEVPKQFAQNGAPIAESGSLGTPMKDRVATLGLLDKRNNISQDLKMKPGESRRIGNVVVKLEGAFVQVYVQERPDVNSPLAWHKVFSGWLFKNAPSVNVVEHPVYDVWVKSCAMSFPGEEAPAATSSAKPSGSPSPAPRPSPTASAAPGPAA
jgi:hypothetical protein